MTRTSDCRTFLWGGTGHSPDGVDGQRSCICEDASWSDRNILGRASCVPDKAHKAFGWVGLGISVGVLCHAAYHFGRQKTFHEQHMSASSSPVERCRRHLHTQTIMAAALSICYFILVLGDALRWCTAVIALAEAPAYIGGSVLASRMWVYTNDPRLLRQSPRVSAMSGWLERPLGNNVACGATAIAPTIAAVLALADFTALSARFVTLGGVVAGLITVGIFIVVGKALLQAIHKSLKKQQQRRKQSAPGGAGGPKDEAGSQTLLEARRKVKTVVVVDIVLVLSGTLTTLLAVITGLDMEAPLLLFGVIFAYVPLIWLAFNIQVHSGRSGSQERPRLRTKGELLTAHPPRPSMTSKLCSSMKHEQQVVPAEAPC